MIAFVNPLAPRKKDRKSNAATIKVWVRDFLQLPEDAVVTVSETACPDAGCPDVETVVSIFEYGRSMRLLRIGRPVERIGKSDVLVAVTFEGSVPAEEP